MTAVPVPQQPSDAETPLPAPPARAVRLGVIGLGWAATKLHLPALAFLQARGWDVALDALCDCNAKRLRSAADRFPHAIALTSAVELLARKSLGGVLILTPPESSPGLLRQAIARRLPSLVEKPVSGSAQDAAALAELASRATVAVQVGYNRRHQTFYSEFHHTIAGFAAPTHVAARFWRVGRKEPGFHADTLVHPLEFLAGTLGALRVTGVKIWPAVNAGSLDSGWRVDLTSTANSNRTAEIDLRPAAARMVESYEAISADGACTLHHPPAGGIATAAVFEHYHRGEPARRMSRTVPAGDLTALALHGGFVSQLAGFVRLCAGDLATPSCDLIRAAEVLELYEQANRLRLESVRRTGSAQ